MTELLVRASDELRASESWLGGSPSAPPGLEWPRCSSCDGAMEFLAQIALGPAGDGTQERLLLFQCENDPGMCEAWDPESGGNAALIVSGSGAVAIAPPDELSPGECEHLALVPLESAGYASEPEAYQAICRQSAGEVLGKRGGEPLWLLDDETPRCGCGEAMRFLVLLEEGRLLDFGGGWGMAFRCPACQAQARLLWQQ